MARGSLRRLTAFCALALVSNQMTPSMTANHIATACGWPSRPSVTRVAVRREGDAATTVTIRPGRGWRQHRPGQYTRIGIDVDGVRLWRAYSITSTVGGDTFTITTDDIVGTKERVSTTFKGLPGDCRPGDVLLIDDGKVSVRVTDVTETDVTTVVEVPGPVSNHKGINLPGVAVSVPAMSEKDIADLRWGLALGADLIALSFVRDAHDAVRGGTPEGLPTFVDGLRAVRVTEAVLASAASRRWVDLS